MKFRPQIQLRFRDADHYERVKAAAGLKDLSVNEYVLQAVEAFNGKVRKAGDDVQAAPVQKKGVQVRGESKGASEVVGKPEDTATVGETRKAKGAVKNCPCCGKSLVPWGNSVRCQECKINYPAEAR